MTVSLRSESAMQGKRAVTAAMPRGVCVYVCMCVCVHPDSKLRVLAKICWFHLVSDAGGSACLTVTAQRRHCQRMVKSGLISQTYLLFST